MGPARRTTTASTVIARRTGITLAPGVGGFGGGVCYRYRMLRSRAFALLLVVAMLALPASSLAQSAGDDQYQDPLAGQGGGGGHSGHSGSAGSAAAGSAPSTPTPAAATSPATTTTPQATAAQSGKGQLPRTGFDVVISFELGLAMLLTGVVAKRMIVLRDRRDQR